jgi:transcription initiation factor TFIIIB Brf1 subunit/transcription initiation factor TFIIB
MDWEKCSECFCPMQVQGLEFVCPECGLISEGPLEMEVFNRAHCSEMMRAAPRLRMVGPDSSWYQRDLDRTSTVVDTSESQRRTIMQELLAYNVAYREKYNSTFPNNVLNAVADHYTQVQKVCVKRSHMKQTILAAMLMHVCIRHNFIRSTTEVAKFMQLNTQGIARGDDFLRSLYADNKIDIDVNADRLIPHVTTAFAKLDLNTKELAAISPNLLHKNHAFDDSTTYLQDAVCSIVRTALNKNIGIQSNLSSKAMASTYEILRRAGAHITLDDVVKRCNIRKNTITRFTSDLLNFHSHFEEIYKNYGLNSSRII